MQARFAHLLSVHDEDLPTLRAHIPPWMYNYKSDINPENLTVEDITKFVDDVFKDPKTDPTALKPFPKSLAPPDLAANVGPVITVVGKTFMKVARDPTKDVVIYFFSPWNEVKPTWK